MNISLVVNFEKDISDLQCIKKMSLTLKRRGKKDEYYFSKKGFKEALALFRLNQKNKISVEMSQKMGYCAERMKNFQVLHFLK
mgnify:CR=1 FL=1